MLNEIWQEVSGRERVAAGLPARQKCPYRERLLAATCSPLVARRRARQPLVAASYR